MLVRPDGLYDVEFQDYVHPLIIRRLTCIFKRQLHCYQDPVITCGPLYKLAMSTDRNQRHRNGKCFIFRCTATQHGTSKPF